MREYLFRGKCDSEWKEGSLHVEWGETRQDGSRDLDYRILGRRGECDYVDPETVGQYTGFLDMNGKRIFEGDIVGVDGKFYEVLIEKGCWIIAADGWDFLATNNDEIEVIGNIHDNPELLKEGGEE